jgi:hypothetical protein
MSYLSYFYEMQIFMLLADFYISARGQLLRLTRTLTPDPTKSNAHANKLLDFMYYGLCYD